MSTRLEKFYKDTVVPQLMKDFGYDNVMQVPRISKISLNMAGRGGGQQEDPRERRRRHGEDRRPEAGTTRRASRWRASDRDGWPIGAKVTLRRAKSTSSWTA